MRRARTITLRIELRGEALTDPEWADMEAKAIMGKAALEVYEHFPLDGRPANVDRPLLDTNGNTVGWVKIR